MSKKYARIHTAFVMFAMLPFIAGFMLGYWVHGEPTAAESPAIQTQTGEKDYPAIFCEATEKADTVETGAEGEPLDPNESENIEAALLAKATKLEDVKMTAYCICEKCCGKSPDHPAYGITASGRKARPDVSVAVDPSIIPLGSDVLIDYGDGKLQYYVADDKGGAIKGNRIDVCKESHQAALEFGVKYATVYFVAPDEEVK